MSKTPAILVFDVGKTNKKILVFDSDYKALHEESIQLAETTDEDSFPCEDIHALTNWVDKSFHRIQSNSTIDVKAINFSAYGASLVYVDENLNPIRPLYNYLKPFPSDLQKSFYSKYGGEQEISRSTASPVLGSLNSGLQLYRMKEEKPNEFKKIKYALHLPQYLSSILTKKAVCDITSIGCHTALWDFQQNKYHRWVEEEKLVEKFPPLVSHRENTTNIGYGLHDSSAALIPYLRSIREPFILISTGTWSISLNPFNPDPLTDADLKSDCLCYMSAEGKPIKASRLFLGNEHDRAVENIAKHFQVDTDEVCRSEFGFAEIRNSINIFRGKLDVTKHQSYSEAYLHLMLDLAVKQILSTGLIKTPEVKSIFVDGGFSRNKTFMTLLAAQMPDVRVYAASVAQGSALGAAMIMHDRWNPNPLPENLIDLKQYPNQF